jgi:hypothetical protein
MTSIPVIDNRFICVQGIEIPLPHSKDPEGFITPDWHDITEFYGAWCNRVAATGLEPWAPQPFLLSVAKELERLEARPGRNAEMWFKRMVQHFGLGWLKERIEFMKRDRDGRLGQLQETDDG